MGDGVGRLVAGVAKRRHGWAEAAAAAESAAGVGLDGGVAAAEEEAAAGVAGVGVE